MGISPDFPVYPEKVVSRCKKSNISVEQTSILVDNNDLLDQTIERKMSKKSSNCLRKRRFKRQR